MAEAIINARFSSRWSAYSAGSHPKGFVHPMVATVLEEKGISHTGTSKGLDAVKGIPFDLIVTVCNSDANDCPVWLGPEGKSTTLTPILASSPEPRMRS